MSVALLITPRSSASTASRTVPIATQDVFRNTWMPAAEQLGLRWIPLFESGVAVAKDDLPEVIREADMLRSWCTSSAPLHESILGRVERLLEELRKLELSGADVDIFIG